MTIKSCDYTDAMENALMTAENHGKAYRLLSTSVNDCKTELIAELKRHHIGYHVSSHARITPMQAATIVDDVIRQWQADSAKALASDPDVSVMDDGRIGIRIIGSGHAAYTIKQARKLLKNIAKAIVLAEKPVN